MDNFNHKLLEIFSLSKFLRVTSSKALLLELLHGNTPVYTQQSCHAIIKVINLKDIRIIKYSVSYFVFLLDCVSKSSLFLDLKLGL